MNKTVNCNCALGWLMRDLVPVPGSEWRKLILVELKPGEEVREHEHEGHALLYYPAAASEIRIRPSAGMMIYLPAGIRHSVPRVDGPRASIAMIVDPPEQCHTIHLD